MLQCSYTCNAYRAAFGSPLNRPVFDPLYRCFDQADQEIWPGEGLFFGLSTVIKFPANYSESPFSVIGSGVTCLPQRVSPPPPHPVFALGYFQTECLISLESKDCPPTPYRLRLMPCNFFRALDTALYLLAGWCS